MRIHVVEKCTRAHLSIAKLKNIENMERSIAKLNNELNFHVKIEVKTFRRQCNLEVIRKTTKNRQACNVGVKLHMNKVFILR